MPGKIFLNYRRDDDPGHTGRLFDQLQPEFPNQLFMDVEGHIKGGDDFVEVLRRQVEACDVLLAVIGPRWLNIADDQGRRRLDNPEDWVRIEIVGALQSGKRIMPVLVGGAKMPRAKDLPEPLKKLARRHAIEIRHERFKSDTQGLISQIKSALTKIDKGRVAEAKVLENKDAPEDVLNVSSNATETDERVAAVEEGEIVQADVTPLVQRARNEDELTKQRATCETVNASPLHSTTPLGRNKYPKSAVNWAAGSLFAGAALVLALIAPWQKFTEHPTAVVPSIPPVVQPSDKAASSNADDEAFFAAERRGALNGYQQYLSQFPSGRHASLANERIAWIRKLEEQFARLSATGSREELLAFANANPAFRQRIDNVVAERYATERERLEADANAKAEEVRRQEEVLTLTKNIQNRLKSLGCYKGLVDGRFGPGSRLAWKRATGENFGTRAPSNNDLEHLNSLKLKTCTSKIQSANDNSLPKAKSQKVTKRPRKSKQDKFQDFGDIRKMPTF